MGLSKEDKQAIQDIEDMVGDWDGNWDKYFSRPKEVIAPEPEQSNIVPPVLFCSESLALNLSDLTINNLQQFNKNAPCVYFLVKNDKVVYVGQSINLGNRLGSHGNKDFDETFWISVAESDQNAIEGAFIRLLRPRLNYAFREFDKKWVLPAPRESSIGDKAVLAKLGIIIPP